MSWCTGLEHICQPDAPLAPLTWYRLGGPARWLVTPTREAELSDVLRRLTEHDVPWRVLGGGANVLVRDEGFAGAVVRLTAPAFGGISWRDGSVTAGGGVDFMALVRGAVEHGLSGLEGLAGVPGTVGGLVRMNAGGRYGCIADAVRRVRLMQPSGVVEERSVDERAFGYRRSDIGRALVLEATFALEPAERESLHARYRRIWSEKAGEQPPVSKRSAGCIFKNPPQHAAGRLIDEAGLKGERRGGAEISTRHANFIVAAADARARDVIDLIELAKQRVLAAYGVELELEVDIW